MPRRATGPPLCRWPQGIPYQRGAVHRRVARPLRHCRRNHPRCLSHRQKFGPRPPLLLSRAVQRHRLQLLHQCHALREQPPALDSHRRRRHLPLRPEVTKGAQPDHGAGTALECSVIAGLGRPPQPVDGHRPRAGPPAWLTDCQHQLYEGFGVRVQAAGSNSPPRRAPHFRQQPRRRHHLSRPGCQHLLQGSLANHRHRRGGNNS